MSHFTRTLANWAKRHWAVWHLIHLNLHLFVFLVSYVFIKRQISQLDFESQKKSINQSPDSELWIFSPQPSCSNCRTESRLRPGGLGGRGENTNSHNVRQKWKKKIPPFNEPAGRWSGTCTCKSWSDRGRPPWLGPARRVKTNCCSYDSDLMPHQPTTTNPVHADLIKPRLCCWFTSLERSD